MDSTSPLASNNRCRQKKLYSFQEARKIARSHGFTSEAEFKEYECAGAYQLPKNVDELYAKEWDGWDDFLGVPFSYDEGKTVVRALGIANKEMFLEKKRKTKIKIKMNERQERAAPGMGINIDTAIDAAEATAASVSVEDDHLLYRLPCKPELYYKKDWISWEDWLGI